VVKLIGSTDLILNGSMMVFMGGVPILFEGRGGGDLVARWNRQGSGQEIIRKAARKKP
jgi:hypothetical protein